MSDHDKVELVAIAQVKVTGGSPGSITFSSNKGFDAASRGSSGFYELQLDHKHDDFKLVVEVARKSAIPGSIQAEILGTGDVDRIQVTNFDLAGVPTDTSFFIAVWRVRS